MKDTFTFRARAMHENAYRPELSMDFITHLRATTRYSKEVLAAVQKAEQGDLSVLIAIIRLKARVYTSLDDLMTAANVAAMHVNNAGYQYWYPMAQLWAARKELACVRS